MKKPNLKMLEIWEATHRKIKVQAAMRDMTMREYVDFIADQDKKAITKILKED